MLTMLQTIAIPLENCSSVPYVAPPPCFNQISGAMSAEPGKRCAYSADIRWRIVYQRIGMNLGYEKIARNLNVSVSTAYRIYHLFLSTDSVNPKPPRKRPEVRTLSPSLEIYVISVVMANPSKFLFEICSEIKEFFDIAVCPSIVCRLLKVHGFTRKKNQQVALQCCDKLRGAFMSQCFFSIQISLYS